jgi:predicted Rdx family selenoprotein
MERRRKVIMPKYVIEREIPGAGNLTPEQLQGVAAKSCDVLRAMGPQIQWVQSYVTNDKVYCVYISPNEQLIRDHAKKGGFPANKISEVREIIDPTTSESHKPAMATA